jgi:hypothetical protein
MAKRTLSYQVGDPNYLKVLLLQEILKTCELIHLRREETGKMGDEYCYTYPEGDIL